jgi:hypothetical protein
MRKDAASKNKKAPKSLAFLKFQLRLTREIRAVYHCRTALRYAERWWTQQPNMAGYKAISEHPGDGGRPFSGMSVTPQEYLAAEPATQGTLRGNAIISIHTAFETYLSDALMRAVYVKPELLAASEMMLEIGEVVKHLDPVEMKRWIGEKAIAKHIYNKSHGEMIEWIDTTFKCGLVNGQRDLVSRWKKWSRIRNELIHGGRDVGAALLTIWRERFEVRKPVGLDDCDVTNCHATAFALAQAIDAQLHRVAIGEHDAMLLARELFVRRGIEDPGALSRQVTGALGHAFKKTHADRALGLQRRGAPEPLREFAFTDEMLEAVVDVIDPNDEVEGAK